MSGVNLKFSKEQLEWAKEQIEESETVNKDSEIANSILGEEVTKDFNLAIARLILQESKK